MKKHRQRNLVWLRAATEAAFNDMGRAELQQAYERFRPRLEAVIQAEKMYIK